MGLQFHKIDKLYKHFGSDWAFPSFSIPTSRINLFRLLIPLIGWTCAELGQNLKMMHLLWVLLVTTSLICWRNTNFFVAKEFLQLTLDFIIYNLVFFCIILKHHSWKSLFLIAITDTLTKLLMFILLLYTIVDRVSPFKFKLNFTTAISTFQILSIKFLRKYLVACSPPSPVWQPFVSPIITLTWTDFVTAVYGIIKNNHLVNINIYYSNIFTTTYFYTWLCMREQLLQPREIGCPP